MNICEQVQERIAENAAAALAADAALRRHVSGCRACGQALERLEVLDHYLGELPEYDAPAKVRDAVVEAVRGSDTPIESSAGYWARGLASAAVIVAAVGLTYNVIDRFDLGRYLALTDAPITIDQRRGADSIEDSLTQGEDGLAVELGRHSAETPRENEAGSLAGNRSPAENDEDLSRAVTETRSYAFRREDRNRPAKPKAEPKEAHSNFRLPLSGARVRNLSPHGAGTDRLAALSAPLAPGYRAELLENAAMESIGQVTPRSSPPGRAELHGPVGVGGIPESAARRADGKASVLSNAAQTLEDQHAEGLSASDPESFFADTAQQTARDYLTALEHTADLQFQEPSGYWANAYVPGDPVIRVLENRLATLQRDTGITGGGPFPPVSRVTPVRQPFDSPRASALALYVHADKTATEGRTRLRLQVGLQSIARPRATRPAARAVLLLDLVRGVDDQTLHRYRGLIEALRDARVPGDEFALVVAGAAGGLLLAPDDFRPGPIDLLLDRLIRTPVQGADVVNLRDAVDISLNRLRPTAGDTDSVNPGLLLVATDRSPRDEIDDLEALVFDGALAGVVTSVISVDGALALDELDRLVLAGQGRRRVLSAFDQAAALIDRELNAHADIVARALRLRIRLAPQVKLLNVLGSERIDAAAVQRTRRIEQHIDRTVAAELGIESDRGEDEEGIQIVIPSFYANDSHVILLDVVAEHPGPIADISVRYKDLVFLRNGLAQGQLDLARGADAAGPLERNVLKNLIAQDLAGAAWTASRQLAGQAPDAALVTLSSMRDLVAGLRRLIPGWDSDPELDRDAQWLDEHIALIDRHRKPPSMLNHLADSLHYASIRKLLDPVR